MGDEAAAGGFNKLGVALIDEPSTRKQPRKSYGRLSGQPLDTPLEALADHGKPDGATAHSHAQPRGSELGHGKVLVKFHERR
jgi:hypothetical protein